MSNISNYNLYSDILKQGSGIAYTEAFNGIFYMLSQHEDDINHFHINSDIFNIVKDVNESDKIKFFNIEENPSYKAFQALIKNNFTFPTSSCTAMPNNRNSLYFGQKALVKNSRGYKQNMSIAQTHAVNDFDLWVKRLFKLKNNSYNFMHLNDHNKNKINVLLGSALRMIYYKNIASKDLNIFKPQKEIKTKIKINKKIKLEKNFDKDSFFISLPSYRMKNNKDLDALDTFIKFTYDNTNYQKLILLSGDNEHKDHCLKKWNIPTTEKYEEIKTRGSTHAKNPMHLHKSKSKPFDYIKDYLYIQETDAKFVHLWNYMENHSENLFNLYPFKEEKTLRLKYHNYQSFDVGARLVQDYKIIDYET
jgi:hypothetical protein